MTGRLLIFNSDQIRTDQNRSDQTHPPLGWVGLGPDPLGRVPHRSGWVGGPTLPPPGGLKTKLRQQARWSTD